MILFLLGRRHKKYLGFFHAIHKKNSPSTDDERDFVDAFCDDLYAYGMSEILIPRIFHQVWINKKQPELPQPFARYRDTWLEKHPGWEYRLWNLENLDFPLVNQDLLDESPGFVYLSDLLRLEVVYHYGGVYFDTDFECYKNIEPLLPNIRIGMGGGVVDPHKNYLSCFEASFFVSQKNNSFLKEYLKNFPSVLGLYKPGLETGPYFLSSLTLKHGIKNTFTLFPKEFFFPTIYADKQAKELQEIQEKGAQIFPESYGIHHWRGSWQEGSSYPRFEKIFRKFKLPLTDLYSKTIERGIFSFKSSLKCLEKDSLKGTVWESYRADAQEIIFRLGNGLAWVGILKVWDHENKMRRLLNGLYRIQGNTITLEFVLPENLTIEDQLIYATYRVRFFEDKMEWKLVSLDSHGLVKKAPKRIIWHKQPKRWNPETFSVEKI